MASTTIATATRTPLPAGVSSYEAEKQKEVQRSTSLGQSEFLALIQIHRTRQGKREQSCRSSSP